MSSTINGATRVVINAGEYWHVEGEPPPAERIVTTAISSAAGEMMGTGAHQVAGHATSKIVANAMAKQLNQAVTTTMTKAAAGQLTPEAARKITSDFMAKQARPLRNNGTKSPGKPFWPVVLPGLIVRMRPGGR